MNLLRSALIVICVTLLMSFETVKPSGEECDLKGIYKLIDLPSGAKGLDDWGSIVQLDNLLLPTDDVEEGRYSVSLTRKESNIYKVDGMDLYIETSYCYEFATYDDAILVVEKGYGRIYGKVIFL